LYGILLFFLKILNGPYRARLILYFISILPQGVAVGLNEVVPSGRSNSIEPLFFNLFSPQRTESPV
jgi:hypothetical protein